MTRLIDADKLYPDCLTKEGRVAISARQIASAPTVKEMEKPFITECKNTAIAENLPLYFVYYEETGVLEVYVTKTNELFEKRHCSKHLSNYEFKEIVTQYLDWYNERVGGGRQ